MKNKFRKIVGTIAILTASILLSACGNSGSADDSTGYVNRYADQISRKMDR